MTAAARLLDGSRRGSHVVAALDTRGRPLGREALAGHRCPTLRAGANMCSDPSALVARATNARTRVYHMHARIVKRAQCVVRHIVFVTRDTCTRIARW